jgi:predicted outer membrane repeat protein
MTMTLTALWQRWLNRPVARHRGHPTPQRRARLGLECLEGREVPASYTAATVPELIARIDAANLSAEADTITLAPGKIFTLTAVNNTSYGYWANGLPVIAAAGGGLTIVGNGDAIERSTNGKTPDFRLFDVQAGASLTLEDLTLQGGSNSVGGAIYNRGTLTMNGVTVQKNIAANGGAIYSSGSLRLQDCLIQDNQAVGSDGSDGARALWSKRDGYFYFPPSPGGWGLGGGVYVAGGTAELLGTTVTRNTAKGGLGGQGKYGLPNAPDGFGQGGGLYIASYAAVVLDAFTATHVTANTADLDPDIYGIVTIS